MWKGLEMSDKVIEYEGPTSLNDPNMRLCINVLTAARPNYLYICLSAIFRNSVFSTDRKPDIYVYIDILPDGTNFIKETLEVLGHFQVQGIFINKSHVGTAGNYWASFRRAFSDGYDYVILIEDDWLITSDALHWFYECPKIAFHYSLYRWSDKMPDDLSTSYTLLTGGSNLSWCVIFGKDSFAFLDSIIKAKAYYGLYYPVVSRSTERRIDYIDWDRTLIAIFKKYDLRSMVPPTSCLAHFGCRTSNAWGFGGISLGMAERMFRGEKEQWIENVIELFNTTTDAEKDSLTFRPHNFHYR